MQKKLVFEFVLVFILGMIVGVYFFSYAYQMYLLTRMENTKSNITVNTSDNANFNNVTNDTTVDATAGWQTYTDTNYNFSFKYPKGLIVWSQAPNNIPGDSYTISINIIGDVHYDKTYGKVVAADVSDADLIISNSSFFTDNNDTSTPVTINSPSGKIIANYSSFTVPMGYTPYVYEFQRGGKYYTFRMNNYDNKQLMAPDQFKKLIETVTFK